MAMSNYIIGGETPIKAPDNSSANGTPVPRIPGAIQA